MWHADWALQATPRRLFVEHFVEQVMGMLLLAALVSRFRVLARATGPDGHLHTRVLAIVAETPWVCASLD